MKKKQKSAVNEKQLAICKQRGHKACAPLGSEWLQCEFCGMWLREVRKIEERRDTPPEEEQSALQHIMERRKKAGAK